MMYSVTFDDTGRVEDIELDREGRAGDIAKQVAREQLGHLREYLMDRVRYYRKQSITFQKHPNHAT